jgi:hypothetical protein
MVAVASVAALALVVALALTFGPHSSSPPAVHPTGPAAPSHQNPAATLLPVIRPLTHTSTPPPPTPTTEQIIYQPFEGSLLDPSLHVASRQSGQCFTYGGGADGRYLYRCGTIQPCFAGSDGTSAPLACPVGADPITNTVILWTATSVDATGFVPAAARTPWAMQLSDGVVCALVNAAWSGLGPFGCGSSTGSAGSASGSAPGPADCRQPVASTSPTSQTSQWTAECQDQLTQASLFSVQPVAKIWF